MESQCLCFQHGNSALARRSIPALIFSGTVICIWGRCRSLAWEEHSEFRFWLHRQINKQSVPIRGKKIISWEFGGTGMSRWRSKRIWNSQRAYPSHLLHVGVTVTLSGREMVKTLYQRCKGSPDLCHCQFCQWVYRCQWNNYGLYLDYGSIGQGEGWTWGNMVICSSLVIRSSSWWEEGTELDLSHLECLCWDLIICGNKSSKQLPADCRIQRVQKGRKEREEKARPGSGSQPGCSCMNTERLAGGRHRRADESWEHVIAAVEFAHVCRKGGRPQKSGRSWVFLLLTTGPQKAAEPQMN